MVTIFVDEFQDINIPKQKGMRLRCRKHDTISSTWTLKQEILTRGNLVIYQKDKNDRAFSKLTKLMGKQITEKNMSEHFPQNIAKFKTFRVLFDLGHLKWWIDNCCFDDEAYYLSGTVEFDFCNFDKAASTCQHILATMSDSSAPSKIAMYLYYKTGVPLPSGLRNPRIFKYNPLPLITRTNPTDEFITNPIDELITNPTDELVTNPTDEIRTSPEEIEARERLNVLDPKNMLGEKRDHVIKSLANFIKEQKKIIQSKDTSDNKKNKMQQLITNLKKDIGEDYKILVDDEPCDS